MSVRKWLRTNHFVTYDWIIVFCENTTGMGGKTGIFYPLEIGFKNQKFLENLTSAVYLRSIDLFLAMTIYFPVWHSHCIRARFTVLVSWGDALKVHYVRSFSRRSKLPKFANRFFYCWSLLRNNNMATNPQVFTSSYSSKRFAACDCWTQTSLTSNAPRQRDCW